MTPLAPEAMRARRRPLVIAIVFALRLLGASAAALPLGAAVVGSGFGAWPGGDAVLWEPGGALLGEFVWGHGWACLAAFRSCSWLALAAACLGLLPTAALMVALGHGGRLSFSWLAGKTANCLGTFTAVTGVTRLAQAALWLAAVLIATAANGPLSARLGERAADLAALGILALAAVGAVILGLLGDVARAAVVRGRVRLGEALAQALAVGRRDAWSLLGAYLPRALTSFAVVVGAAAVALAVGLDRPDGWRVALALLVCQAAALGLVWLEASWLARALGHVLPAGDDGDGQ
jgi:hypothetical protein